MPSYPGSYEYNMAESDGHCHHGYPTASCEACHPPLPDPCGAGDAIVTAADWESDLAHYNAEAAAEANRRAECEYCGEVTYVEAPAVEDDAAWDEQAEEHAEGCEWVETRAHQLEQRQFAMYAGAYIRLLEKALRGGRVGRVVGNATVNGNERDGFLVTITATPGVIEVDADEIRAAIRIVDEPDALTRIARIRADFDARPDRLTVHYPEGSDVGFAVAGRTAADDEADAAYEAACEDRYWSKRS